jgi:hypothetical protein
LPVYNTVLHLLTNPIYAGAYAFGLTCSRVSVREGRKRVVRGYRRAQSDWEVLLPHHHEGYISWEEFERNQRLIADNANSKGLMTRGSVRRGDALLAGLLRCGAIAGGNCTSPTAARPGIACDIIAAARI